MLQPNKPNNQPKQPTTPCAGKGFLRQMCITTSRQSTGSRTRSILQQMKNYKSLSNNFVFVFVFCILQMKNLSTTTMSCPVFMFVFCILQMINISATTMSCLLPSPLTGMRRSISLRLPIPTHIQGQLSLLIFKVNRK